MVNFIICDDSSNTREEVHQLITKYMLKIDMDYQTHFCPDYNENFYRILDTKMPFKVYILDIEAPSRNGIDIAEMVRNKEPQSSIIIISGHDEYESEMLKREIGFISFLHKDSTFEERFERSLNRVFELIDQKKLVKFTEKGVMYCFAASDVLYVLRDSVERKSVIVTDYGEYRSYKSLKKLKSELGYGFSQTHKGCIVNMRRATSINKNKNTIMLDNGENIDYVSDKYKKELTFK